MQPLPVFLTLVLLAACLAGGDEGQPGEAAPPVNRASAFRSVPHEAKRAKAFFDGRRVPAGAHVER